MSEPRIPLASGADAYVNEELAAARKSLKNTQLFGSIIVGVLCLYLIIVTVKFASFMKPEPAAAIATGFAVDQIEKYHDAFVADVQQRVPAMIRQSPDYVLQQMPVARKSVGDNFESELRKYCQSTNDKLIADFDRYFAENKTQIQAVLAATKEPNAARALGPDIRRKVIAAYMQEEPAGGQSAQEQVNESFAMLANAQRRIHRLATARDLTPAEKKTRRAIAIVMDTVSQEYLQPMTLPARVPPPQS